MKAEVIKLKQEREKDKPDEIKVPEVKYMVEDSVQTDSGTEKDLLPVTIEGRITYFFL